MDKLNLMVPNFLPKKEFFIPEKNQTCPGCGLSLAVRQVYKTIESLINDGTYDMSGSHSSGNTDVTILKIPNNNGEIIICLDNEAGGSLNNSLRKTYITEALEKGYKYLATVSPSYPFDLYDKVIKGKETEGDAYIHILTPCPVKWQFDSEYTVKIGYLAVESRAFPLYEIEDGSYKITVDLPKPRPVSDYLKIQKRFAELTEDDIKNAQTQIDNEYEKLKGKV